MSKTKDNNKAMALTGISLSSEEVKKTIDFTAQRSEEINAFSKKLSEAQAAVKIANQKVEEAKIKADAAKEKAEERKKEKQHWYDSDAKAINKIHDDLVTISETHVELSEAQKGLALAQERALEAQTKSFEFQKRITEITTTMIKFSVVNIATSRIMVNELEMRLSGASKEKLSDLAKKEIENVLVQIKTQQDILGRQAHIEEVACELDERIENSLKADKIRDLAIEKQMETGHLHELRLNAQEKTLKDIYRATSNSTKRQDNQENQIKELFKANESNREVILKATEKIKTQDERTTELFSLVQAQKNTIEQIHQESKDKEKVIAEEMEKFAFHEKEINQNSQDISELKKLEEDQSTYINKLKENLQNQERITEKQRNEIKELKSEVENLKLKISMQKSNLTPAIIISGVALAISILQAVLF